MGLAIAFEARRSPLLAESRVLRPLAIFGLIHGSHEWFEMFLDKSDWLVVENLLFINWLRIVLLTISFISLLLFAWRSIDPQKTYSSRENWLWGAFFAIYTLAVMAFGYFSGRYHPDSMNHMDALIRYLIAVPGAFLAGWALNIQAIQANRQHRQNLGKSLRWSAIGFFLYGITQLFTPQLDALPASVINTANFLLWTGVPIQFIRAITAVLITVSLIYASQLVEVERQSQFLAAQQARLQAVDQLRQELMERERMRQELMRHIVIAQEDERARIARELHDETSQILTGFSLHLAALSDTLPDFPQARDKIRHLQTLSKQISQGLYNMVHDLRPAQLDDLGLAAALHYLTEEARKQFDLKVHLQITGQRRRLDALIETVVFRIAQEALTNVARHAQTQEAQIFLNFMQESIELQISDRGVGFDMKTKPSSSNGWGLAGMKERADSVGGKLEIRSEPGQGTMIHLLIPANTFVESEIALNQRRQN